MNNTSREDFETLSKEVNKRIHACKDCEGVGGKDVVMIDIGGADYPDYDVCTTCQDTSRMG